MLLHASCYVAAVLASVWPTLVKSLVLMSSAGKVVVGEPFMPLSKVRLFLSSPFLCYCCSLILKNHSVERISGFLCTIELPYM